MVTRVTARSKDQPTPCMNSSISAVLSGSQTIGGSNGPPQPYSHNCSYIYQSTCLSKYCVFMLELLWCACLHVCLNLRCYMSVCLSENSRQLEYCCYCTKTQQQRTQIKECVVLSAPQYSGKFTGDTDLSVF